MACRHPAGTTAPPPPAIPHPPRRRPRWTARGRSPSRIVADAHAAPPAADQVNASVTDPPCPTAVSVLPSQLLTVKVLRRPVESALAAPVRVMHQPLQPGLAAPDGHLEGVQGQIGTQRPRGLPAH